MPHPIILANTGNRVNRKGDRMLQAQQVLQERYQLQQQLGRTYIYFNHNFLNSRGRH
ncbi:hypothetical protein [Allocoleopsis sp.]|uniref:hypothetical protein n=1 Tax=Allocoleopsis sp. TaxID=3088169 RepID=UPI002FD0C7ED